jgi:hypothetical protein
VIDIKKVALFIPPGMKGFKQKLFEGIGAKIGRVVRNDPKLLDELPADIIPVVGCTPFLRPWYEKWNASGRNYIYWDRGYLRRVFATWLPRGSDMGISGGYYRWHINNFQMQKIYDVPDDRWKFLKLDKSVKPWNKNGKHIIVADTLHFYWDFIGDLNWVNRTVDEIKKHTDRKIIIRKKEINVPGGIKNNPVDLFDDLKDAHCLVAHGSIAAIESVVMGCPVFVDKVNAARLVGQTDFSKIETPVYPERQPWFNSLAYCQFNEAELVDGTLWRLLQ